MSLERAAGEGGGGRLKPSAAGVPRRSANQVITMSVTLLLRSGEIGQVPGDML